MPHKEPDWAKAFLYSVAIPLIVLSVGVMVGGLLWGLWTVHPVLPVALPVTIGAGWLALRWLAYRLAYDA